MNGVWVCIVYLAIWAHVCRSGCPIGKQTPHIDVANGRWTKCHFWNIFSAWVHLAKFVKKQDKGGTSTSWHGLNYTTSKKDRSSLSPRGAMPPPRRPVLQRAPDMLQSLWRWRLGRNQDFRPASHSSSGWLRPSRGSPRSRLTWWLDSGTRWVETCDLSHACCRVTCLWHCTLATTDCDMNCLLSFCQIYFLVQFLNKYVFKRSLACAPVAQLTAGLNSCLRELCKLASAVEAAPACWHIGKS